MDAILKELSFRTSSHVGNRQVSDVTHVQTMFTCNPSLEVTLILLVIANITLENVQFIILKILSTKYTNFLLHVFSVERTL